MNIICLVSPSYQVVRTSVWSGKDVLGGVANALKNPSRRTVQKFMGPEGDCSREAARARTARAALLVSIYI